MGRYIDIIFKRNGMATYDWTEEQCRSYLGFKGALENEGIISDISSEFGYNYDVLEINRSVQNSERLIYYFAEKCGLEQNLIIYETYRYDIVRAIINFGVPRIVDNFGRVINLQCDESSTPHAIMRAFEDVGIDLDDVNLAGTWGGEMVWVTKSVSYRVDWDQF